MAKSRKEAIRPGMLVMLRQWEFMNPTHRVGLVVQGEHGGLDWRGIRVGVLVDSGRIESVETNRLRVISRPYVQYKETRQ